MAPFGGKRKKLLGLDIGSTAVKVLELSTSNGSYRVENYALEALPPNAIVERNISDVEQVGEAVKRAVARSNSRATRAALAVGGAAVIARTVTMEASLSDAEIEKRISGEAERYIPYPPDEAAIDFEVRGLSEQHAELADVLLVGCRRLNIDRLSAALAAAGLKPAVVEPEVQAVERLFEVLKPRVERQAGELVSVIADFGGTLTTLWVLVDGRSEFTRELPIGGKSLVEAIPERYPLPYARAEHAQAEHAQSEHAQSQHAQAEIAGRGCSRPEGLPRSVVQPFNEEAAQQLSRVLRLFYSSTHYRDVDHVMLIGGAAHTMGLAGAVQNALGAPAAVANPFADMSRAAHIDAAGLARDAAALALACGLAMRNLQ